MGSLKKALPFAFPIVFTLACAALAAYFTISGLEWFKTLELPAFLPPPLVFRIVWGALYILLAVSFTMYNTGEKKSFGTFLLYILNGLLNPLWTYVFFSVHSLFGAFFLLIGMFALAVILYKRVVEQNKTAAALLLPYILWLAFALYLNYETAFLN